MKYPHSPGYKEPTTSKEAAERMEPKLTTIEGKCLQLLRLQALTRDECAKLLGESVLSVRPRFNNLEVKGLIKKTGEKRMNDSGMRAHVYKAVKEEKAVQESLFKRAA